MGAEHTIFHFAKSLWTLFIAGCLIALIDSCKEDEPGLPHNLPPGPFTVSTEVIGNTATVSWTEAIDPEGDSVTYNVFLEGNEIQTGLKVTSFVIPALDYETNYPGKVVAQDQQGASSESNFNYEIGELREPEIEWDVRIPETGGSCALLNQADGGFILAVGSSLIKLDSEGTVIWKKDYSGGSISSSESLIQTADGGYALVGFTGSIFEQGFDYWIARLGSSGDLLWEQSFGDLPSDIGRGRNLTYDYDIAYSVQETLDGGFLVAGESEGISKPLGAGNAIFDYWLLKLDSDGTLQWEKRLNGSDTTIANIYPGLSKGRSVKPTNDGGYIIGGNYQPNDHNGGQEHEGTGYWLVKLDASYNHLWDKFVGPAPEDRATSSIAYNFQTMLVTSGGGYVIAGKHDDVAPTTLVGLNGDYHIVKLDVSGSVVWEKQFGSPYVLNGQQRYEQPQSIHETYDGGYLIAGASASAGGDVVSNYGKLDYWLVKVNSSGDLEWEKNLGGSENDRGFAGIQTNDGGYLIAGSSVSSDGDVSEGGDDGVWVVKLK